MRNPIEKKKNSIDLEGKSKLLVELFSNANIRMNASFRDSLELVKNEKKYLIAKCPIKHIAALLGCYQKDVERLIPLTKGFLKFEFFKKLVVRTAALPPQLLNEVSTDNSLAFQNVPEGMTECQLMSKLYRESLGLNTVLLEPESRNALIVFVSSDKKKKVQKRLKSKLELELMDSLSAKKLISKFSL